MKKLVILFCLPIILLGCSALMGEEIARLSINQVSTEGNPVIKEVSLDLKKGEEIAIWSDMDFAYEGQIALRFRIEILKNNEDFGGQEIDPTIKNITLGEARTTINNKTDWNFSGENSEIKIEEDATYTFRAILVASDNPTLKIEKAELVLKR